MLRLLGVLATFATLVYLTPTARAQSSSDFEASLAVTKMRTMGERLNNIELRIGNVDGLTYSISVAAPWEMAELTVTRDGVVLKPGKKRSDAVNCGGPVNLPAGWEMAVSCGYGIQDGPYVVGRTWSLSDFGYDLTAPGHYVIRARVRISDVRPVGMSNATVGTVIYLDTAPIEMDIPR